MPIHRRSQFNGSTYQGRRYCNIILYFFSSLYFKGQKEMFSVDLYFVSVKFLMCYTILTFQLSTQFIYYDI